MKKRSVSIKAKLLLSTIPFVIVMAVILVLVSYQLAANIIKNSSQDNLQSSVQNQVSSVEGWLSENLAGFSMAKMLIERTNPSDDELQKILNDSYGYNDNYPEGIYIADAQGTIYKAQQSTKSEKDVTNSTWYQEGLTRINMAVGTEYQNGDGTYVISASGILNDGSDEIRVISADMTLDRIAIIVNSFIEMDKAETVLVDRNSGIILASRDASLISTKLGSSGQSEYYKDLGQKISDKDYEFCTLDEYMTVFEEVEGTNWIMISYIPTDVVFADLFQLRNILIIIGIVSIAILCILVERMTHRVIKPVKKITKVVTAMADGDFTVSLKTKGNDEIAVMGRSVEQFIVSMRSMITSIGDVSEKLEQQAASSKQRSNEMYQAAEIQSQSMGELNATVDQLSVSVNEIAENASQLAGVVSDTKKDSSEVEKKMEETVIVSEQGRKDMQRVSLALEEIRKSMQNLSTAVNKVGTASEEIVQITKLIGDIAEETNLLSLNASIEAARAGEAGRGFAVVATEIGNLANNSADSVKNITELVTQINTLVRDAVQQAGSSVTEIHDSAGLIDVAMNTFDTIFKNINDTSELIGRVVNKMNEVDMVASNVAAISEEQAASSDEILATSESMLTQAKNISSNSQEVEKEAENLAQSSEELTTQMNQFQI